MLKKKKPPNKHHKHLILIRGRPYKFSPRNHRLTVKKVEVKKTVRKSRSIFSVKNVGFCLLEGLQGDGLVFDKCQEVTKKFVKPYIPIAVEYFVYPLFKSGPKRCCCTDFECRFDCPGKTKTKDVGCTCKDDDLRAEKDSCCVCDDKIKTKKKKTTKIKIKKEKKEKKQKEPKVKKARKEKKLKKEKKEKKLEVCGESSKFIGCARKKKRSFCFRKKKKKTTICWCSLSESGKSAKNIQIGSGHELCQCDSEVELSANKSGNILQQKTKEASMETDCKCGEKNFPCKHCTGITKSADKTCHAGVCNNSSHEMRSEGPEMDYCPCCKAPLTPELRSNLNSWKTFNQSKTNNSNNHTLLFNRPVKFSKECICKTDTSISID